MGFPKRHFIKDPIWGNIELLPWEANLLSQFLVNRLHYVLQTSTAFLVYPGLRYSRFSHSLGTMYVATQLFSNILINAISSGSKHLKDLEAECQLIEANFTALEREQFVKIITTRLHCDEKHALLLGTIRVAALLHDLGHLPYSHIFEFALGRFIERSISENFNMVDHDLNSKEQEALTEVHKNLNEVFGKSGQIHETLGHDYFLNLLIAITDENFVPFVKGAKQLLAQKELPVSKSILDAYIDADKIDYVSRDGHFSGLFKNPTDFGRLFSFYELCVDEKEGSVIAFPNERATSESEKLIWHQFQEYKYIMAHHKVHLFDELLERLLYLSICDGSLNLILEAIQTLTRKQSRSYGLWERQESLEAEMAIRYFNDSWIDVQLRDSYELSHIGDVGKRTKKMQVLFEGLAEHRNLFRTLFKRDDEYQESFAEFLDSLLRKIYPSKGEEEIIQAKRDVLPLFITTAVRKNKYDWEQELSEELGTTVIMGDLYGKLIKRLHTRVAADRSNLSKLQDYMKSRYSTSRTFNVWYYLRDGQHEERELRRKIVAFMQQKIEEQFTKELGTVTN